jgi:hypothetical protein
LAVSCFCTSVLLAAGFLSSLTSYRILLSFACDAAPSCLVIPWQGGSVAVSIIMIGTVVHLSAPASNLETGIAEKRRRLAMWLASWTGVWT